MPYMPSLQHLLLLSLPHMLVKIFKKTLRIEMYYETDEMPMDRYMLFNKYLFLESGIGSSFEDYIQKNNIVRMHIKRGEFTKADQELYNQVLTASNAINEINFEYNAFVAAIHSINGVINSDVSEEGIKRTQKLLNSKGVTLKFVKESVDQIKKKVETELSIYFPKKFKRMATISFYQIVKRTELVLDEIISDRDNKEFIEDVDYQLLPDSENYAGENGFEVNYINNFEDSCLVIGEKFGKDAKKMSVLEFFRAEQMLKKQKNPEKGKTFDRQVALGKSK